MKTYILLIAFLCSFPYVFGQEDVNVEKNDTTKSYLDYLFEYKIALPERKNEIDSMMSDYENYFKSKQVKSICGVKFGKSKDEVLPILKNKFGKPSEEVDDNMIYFKDIKYAGIDFNTVFFGFQSDGYKTYFNTCVFVVEAKTNKDVDRMLFRLNVALADKYSLYDENKRNENSPTFIGGISPLWDGKWYTLVENSLIKIVDSEYYRAAVRTDVIEYEEDVAKEFGIKYGVRLIYGPFNYVKEEF